MSEIQEFVIFSLQGKTRVIIKGSTASAIYYGVNRPKLRNISMHIQGVSLLFAYSFPYSNLLEIDEEVEG